MLEFQVKMWREVLSHIDTPTFFTKMKWDTLTQSIRLLVNKAAVNLLLQTPTCLNLQSWATSLVTLRHIQTLSSCGRPNSVTLPTEPR